MEEGGDGGGGARKIGCLSRAGGGGVTEEGRIGRNGIF